MNVHIHKILMSQKHHGTITSVSWQVQNQSQKTGVCELNLACFLFKDTKSYVASPTHLHMDSLHVVLR